LRDGLDKWDIGNLRSIDPEEPAFADRQALRDQNELLKKSGRFMSENLSF